ncbi:unnamed protein product [Ceratitis capitata]|uniref:(Mediterranean fruit fly) hypothetical protein n=1 Tax=Ceratitis capitata TaxID=7213 RepID=A0A811V485_CERCA|nr:unnamed protein product [Ceratitis capitata]
MKLSTFIPFLILLYFFNFYLQDDDMGFSSRMDCCGQFVKYSLFISNLIIFIGGATVFTLTLWTLVDRSFMNELLGTNLFSGAVYVLLVTSVAICLLSFWVVLARAKKSNVCC